MKINDLGLPESHILACSKGPAVGQLTLARSWHVLKGPAVGHLTLPSNYCPSSMHNSEHQRYWTPRIPDLGMLPRANSWAPNPR